MDDLLELPVAVEVELYRIAQEALNNALKHTAASEVTVRMCVDCGEIVLEVVDNGRGFDPQKARRSGGMGLVSMEERGRIDRRFAAHFVGRGARNDRVRAGSGRLRAADVADVRGRRRWRQFEF